jgi:predicted enzyme related to lactoylglutathione lyase
MPEEKQTHIDEVRTVSVPVSNVDRALDFYTTKLGFEIRLDAPFGEGRRWVEVAAPGAATTIALAPPGPGQMPGIDTGIRFTTSDVEADHADLQSRGVDVDADILRWPGAPPMFQMRDPDGNLLRVVQRTEATGAEQHASTAARRFAVFVKSDETAEAGVMPDQRSLTDMIRFNDELANAGMMLAADGLQPTSHGARIVFATGEPPKVMRGPFPETKHLVAGYWIIQAGSLDEVIDWMKRAPFGDGAEIEIRQCFEPDEFGEAYTPELREQERRQQLKMEENARRRAA